MSLNQSQNVSQPLISVITVTFNAELGLEQTINSVLNQGYQNIELIIVDGASTDGTIDILKKYNDKITYWISEPDKGVYDAMNKALDVAKGDWIYFLGAGDLLHDVVSKIAPQLVNSSTIYYGNVYRSDLSSVYDGAFSAYKLAIVNICHQAIFYHSSVFKRYRYNNKYKIFADHALNMQCYGDKEYNFKYLPIIVCTYEGDGYSAKTIDLPFFADKMNIIKLNFPFLVYAYALTRRFIARMIKPPYQNSNT